MRRRGWLSILLVVALLLAAVAAGLLYLGSQRARNQIRAYLETALSQELRMPVRLGSVGFSMGVGQIEVRKAGLLDPETGSPLLEVERLRVRLALWPLLRRELNVRSVSVTAPRLHLEDSPRLRALVQGLLARLIELARATEGARFPVSMESGVVRYKHQASGVAVDIDGLRLGLRWETSGQAIASLAGESRLLLGGRDLGGIGLEGRVRLGGKQWEVIHLQFVRSRSALRLQGMVASAGETPRIELSAEGTLILDELGPLLFPGEDLKGAVIVSGTLRGDQLPPTFEGTLKLADGVVRGFAVTHAQASLAVRPGTLEVVSLNGRVGGGALSASGTYEPGEVRYRGRLTLKEVSLEQGLQVLRWPGPFGGQVTGSVEGSGRGRRVEELSLRLDLSGHGLRAKDGNRRADARLVGRVEGGILKVERLTLVREGSEAVARGSVNLATQAQALTISGSIADLEQGLWPWAVQGVSGRLSFSGRLGRTLKAPAFSGQVRGQGLSFKAVRLSSVEGPVEVEREFVASRGIKIAVGRSLGVLSGEMKLPPGWREAGNWQEALTLALKLEGKGRVEDLVAWLPHPVPLSGPFNFQLTASGRPKSLTGTGQMEARELRVGTERLESLRVALGVESSELTVRSLTGVCRGVPFRVEGRLALSGSYRFTLVPVKLDLATFPVLPDLGGTAVLSARGAGHLSRPQLEGNLALADVMFRDLRIGKGSLQFSLDQSLWRWELGLDDGVRARGTAPLAFDRPLQADVVATDLDLTPYLRALRHRLPFSLTVRADGNARLMAELPGFRNLRGRIELAALRCQVGEIPCQLRAPTAVAVGAGALQFDALDLVGPGLLVTVKGSVRPGERTDLELSGHAPFPIVEPWVPPVSDIKGTPHVRVSLAGSPDALRVTGRAELRGVEVRLKPLPIWLSVVTGEVNFDNDRVHYILSEGTAAGGRLDGRGASERRGERWHHTFELKLDKADLEHLYDQLQIGSRWASGDLLLSGSLGLETGPGLAPLTTLAGTLSATLKGGSLSHYPALVRIFGLIGSPHRLPDLAQERMPYRRISADFRVSEGVMETKNLLLDSQVVRVSGVGKIRLPEQTIDFDLGVRPLQVLERGIRKVPVLRRLLPQEQGLAAVYFELEGPWNDPKTSVAPVKSLSKTVVDLLLFLLRAPDRLLTPPEPAPGNKN